MIDRVLQLSGLWWCTLVALSFLALCTVAVVVRRELRGRS